METFLRRWRDDAVSRHQYDSAIYVGDKLVALTNSDDDRLVLAQTHFAAGNYTRAFAFVSRSDLLQRSSACKYLAAHCYIRQDRHEDALGILGDKNPTHLISTTDGARRKLQGLGNGVSSKQHGKTRMPNRIERADRSEERDAEGDATNFKYEAGMCHLRGLCFAKSNAFDRAKECYKDAVRIDVQCFEAFDQLMKNSLMSPREEWDFLDSLNFETLQPDPMDPNAAPEAADFVRNLYITRLSKYHRLEDFSTAIDTLSSHYHLSQNADVLLAKAEILSSSARYQPALTLTSAILSADPYNFAALPLHLSLLYQLKHTHALFSLSHDLADTHPNEPTTWLAVGTYYLATARIPEARSYFSKASLMDPHFGPAWIGFAHTFAAEGESDQAIAAYSTAARLFQGTHLPQMFLGMQETALGNLTIAREYLTAAYDLCDRDPALLNEIGVVAYLEDDPDAACRHFELALSIATQNETPPSQMTATRLNLAHAHRRAGRLPEALEEYEEVVRLGLREAGVFAAKGLVLLELEQPFEATVAFHEALSISPQDPIAGELLSKALLALEGQSVMGARDEESVNAGLMERVREIKQAAASGSGRKGRRRRVVHEDGMDLDGAGV
jgi:anaphase-promoting complex subunit 6